MKNNKSLATVVVVLFVIVALLEIGSLFFVGKEIQEMSSEAIENAYTSVYEYQDRMRGMEVYAFLSNMIELAALITFLSWFYNAYANLSKAGIKPVNYSSGFAVWAWIIPILNLFKPFQLTKEVVDKSQQKVQELDSQYVPQSLNGLINSCWVLFLIHSFFSTAVFIWAVNNNSFEAGVIVLKVGIGLSVLMMVIILLLASIVYKVSQVEERLYQVVNK